MKKLIALSMAVLLCLLTACAAADTTKNLAGDDNFYIAVVNDASDDIYGIHYEYYLGDRPIGGGEVLYADNTAIRKQDVLSKVFLAQDFPEGSDISKMSVEFFVVKKDRSELTAGKVMVSARYGETYYFNLTGDAGAGYAVLPV